jgi:hypothetical protein
MEMEMGTAMGIGMGVWVGTRVRLGAGKGKIKEIWTGKWAAETVVKGARKPLRLKNDSIQLKISKSCQFQSLNMVQIHSSLGGTCTTTTTTTTTTGTLQCPAV